MELEGELIDADADVDVLAEPRERNLDQHEISRRRGGAGSSEGPRGMGIRPQAGGSSSRREGFGTACAKRSIRTAPNTEGRSGRRAGYRARRCAACRG